MLDLSLPGFSPLPEVAVETLAKALHEITTAHIKEEIRSYVIWELADDATQHRRRCQAAKMLERFTIRER